MRDNNERPGSYYYYGSGGGGGVRCMRRELGSRRWVAEGRQPSLYSRSARTTNGMSDRGRRKTGRGGCRRCRCPCQGQGFSRPAIGMREERRMTGGGGGGGGGGRGGRRTKTTQQQQLHIVVSPTKQRRCVITIRGGKDSCCGGYGGGYCCGSGVGKNRARRFSDFTGVNKKFKCPTGRHIHYANIFGQNDSHRCQCEFLNCDTTSLRDVSLSDAIVDIFHENLDDIRRRQQCQITSQNVATKKATASFNPWKHSNPGSVFNYRILLHVILLFYSLSHFSTFANAAYQSSPSSSSSPTSSKHTRYNSLPPSQLNSSSILIHFNPPSITNLQINKPQTVFFNFTIYQRPWSPQALNQNNNNNDDNNNNKGNNINTATNITSHQKTTSNEISSSISKASKSEIPLSDSAFAAVATPTIQTTNTFLGKNNISGQQQQQAGTFLLNSTTTPPSSTYSSPNSTRNHSNNSTPSPPILVNDATPGTFQDPNDKPQQHPQHGQQQPQQQPRRYWVMIYSNDDNVAHIKLHKGAGETLAFVKDKEGKEQDSSYLLMTVTPGRQYNFSVEAKHIGRTTMSLAVVDAGGMVIPQPKAEYVQTVASSQYDVAAVRGERTADAVFDSAAAAIAILISFGMGATTDIDSIKRQLNYPVSLIVGFCCQFIIMPVLAFGVAMALPRDKDIQFGLLCTACVPGGGLGHIFVVIADGDTALSMTINLISNTAMLWTAPLWIFVLGQYFQPESNAALSLRMLPIFNFEIWLAASFLAYMAGLIIKRFRSPVADAILMWLIKPFLLLASILYITIGVYINMYVFDMMKEFALLGAVLLPFCGCVLGAGLAALCRQGNTFIKTIALETASLNCVVVLVALRFSLRQPDADLASMIPIWVLFTTPGLFVFLSICKKVKGAALHYWRNRNANSKKDAELLGSMKAYSVSSSAVSPPGTTTLSAPLVVADGVDDDLTISTTSNQKVTVL